MNRVTIFTVSKALLKQAVTKEKRRQHVHQARLYDIDWRQKSWATACHDATKHQAIVVASFFRLEDVDLSPEPNLEPSTMLLRQESQTLQLSLTPQETLH